MNSKQPSYKKLWLSLTAVMTLSFLVLGYFGWEIYHQAPPVPKRVVTSDGKTVFTGQDIKDGQNVWQSIGGEEVGTVWGHGAYVAPDWSADWLHRESVWLSPGLEQLTIDADAPVLPDPNGHYPVAIPGQTKVI